MWPDLGGSEAKRSFHQFSRYNLEDFGPLFTPVTATPQEANHRRCRFESKMQCARASLAGHVDPAADHLGHVFRRRGRDDPTYSNATTDPPPQARRPSGRSLGFGLEDKAI